MEKGSKNIEQFCPKNQQDWRAWLVENHKDNESIWLVFYKKKSPNYNLSWSDAVDEALCFGWIDSTKRSLDNERYIQYFTKRKPKSNWSKVNKDKVKVLIETELMQEAGFKTIEIAKENGSWTILDEVEALIVPKDLTEEFKKHKGSLEYFESLSNSVKKTLLYWIMMGKREETRNKRITEIAERASKNEKPRPFW